MQSPYHILRYAVAAIVVMMLGGLLGWYVFVHRQVATTQANDAARGFGTAASFGSAAGSTYTNSVQSAATTETQPTAGGLAPRLWKVTGTPVAGEGFAASSSQLYFAERSSGNVLRADPLTSSVTRLTNTLFPKVYEALFATDGSVLLRAATDAGTVTTFAGTISTTTEGAAPLAGTYLPQNIESVSVRSQQQLFFLVAAPTGGVAGVTANWKGASQKPVFASTLSQWRTWWLPDGRMYIAQKPADDVMGYAFSLKNGALSALVNAPGLSILPRTGSTALMYSSSAGGGVLLFGQTSASTTPVRLDIRTLAEKCVWAPGRDLIAYCAVPQTPPTRAGYMGEWYRGAMHTSDAWWKVDVSAGTVQALFTPDSNTLFDVEHPDIDAGGNYLAFINAADKSLWMLRITP